MRVIRHCCTQALVQSLVVATILLAASRSDAQVVLATGTMVFKAGPTRGFESVNCGTPVLLDVTLIYTITDSVLGEAGHVNVSIAPYSGPCHFPFAGYSQTLPFFLNLSGNLWIASDPVLFNIAVEFRSSGDRQNFNLTYFHYRFSVSGLEYRIDMTSFNSVDSDNDGVLDSVDQCPGTAPQTPVDEVGCPLPQTCRPDKLRVLDVSERCYPFLSLITPAKVTPFADGSKLEVTCEGLIRPTYIAWYTNAAGARHKVAQCLFSGGANLALFTYADENGDRIPDCLATLEWENVDLGSNDGPRQAEGFVFTTPEEPYLDVVRYSYDAVANKLSWTNLKFLYPAGTQAATDENVIYRPGVLPVPGKGVSVDPIVDDFTDGLFDQLRQQLQWEPAEPMIMLAACDLNFDRRCDELDWALFETARGTCLGQPGYLPFIDLIRDGCVDDLDSNAWAESFQATSDSCTKTQGYWKRQRVWPVSSLSLSGWNYSQDELRAILQAPVKGNGALILAQQLIAARLNAIGDLVAPNATIATAEQLLSGLDRLPPYGGAFLSPSQVVLLVGALADYNEGRVLPGACKKE